MNVPIKMVCRLTGLSSHVIRVWEKRYAAVEPERTETNRRLYSEGEVRRLQLLKRLTQSGHSIGQVARLDTAELETLVAASPGVQIDGEPERMAGAGRGSKAPAKRSEEVAPEVLIEQALEAVRTLDHHALEKRMQEGATRFGNRGLLQKVVGPLVHQIGESWRSGDLTAAQEHFASAVIRGYLTHSCRPYAASDNVPTLVVTTPAGQLHELGAVMAMAAAADEGWRVTYLGPSLPAAEIAGAAVQNRARAVALSIVYPEDDPHLAHELQALRRHLPEGVGLIIGGRAAGAYREALEQIGAAHVEGIEDLCRALNSLRASHRNGRA